MAYTKKTWVAGEILKAVDLNHMEDGIAQAANILPSKSASGTTISFNDGADSTLKSLVLNIEPAQSGSGDPSPSNIRPISGYDAVNVVRTGNRYANTVLSGYLDTSGKYKTSSAGSKSVYAQVDAGTVYIRKNASSVFRVGMFDSVPAANAQSTNFVDIGATATTYELDVPSAGYLTVFVVNSSSSTDLANSDEILASVAISDKPITTYPISLSSAGTVYGGSLDVTSGELVVDRVVYTSDGTETWTKASTSNTYYYNNGQRKRALNTILASSHLQIVSNVNTYQSTEWTCFSGEANNSAIYMHLSNDITTVDSAKEYLAAQHSAGTPLQWYYLLETPITYQLTPTEVTTLLGENTIWMDAEGTMELTYRADMNMYIDNKINATRSIIAGIESTNTATSNYSTGDLLIVGDTLYKATAAIASGGTITAGTNVTATTVAEQLIALASA